ncbi:FMN reductase [Devosia lucknowensis]|uniref:FMN reductase n=1 Tax=Devosia lucknowensis TaxID=1096929 RepID=A0A1Y6GBS8_9HYPH|nr:FMN reductase [Devosia lucknowensis]SMQ86188.1 FMN reductase [Devosia lucknowensis]
MSQLNIVGFAGSSSTPSRTRSLVETVVAQTAGRVGAETRIYDLVDIHPSLGATLDARHAPPDLVELIDTITAADALVVGSPVYKGTYTGLFKHLFDLIDPKALKDKPIVLTATGGSERHALVVDHGLRPLFAFFSADILSTGIYATEPDFTDYLPSSDNLRSRIGRVVDELSWRLNATRGTTLAQSA